MSVGLGLRRYAVSGEKESAQHYRITSILHSHRGGALFILVAGAGVSDPLSARERSHYVYSRPRRKLTLHIDAEGLVTHEQPVGLRPRHLRSWFSTTR